MVGAADAVHPSWFKNPELGETDSDALQQAIDSCVDNCDVIITRPLGITKVGSFNLVVQRAVIRRWLP
jgi:hypothetical protein